MRCPACRHPNLIRDALEPVLSAHFCRQCGGQWIEGAQYWRWLELTTDDNAAPASIHSAAPDSNAGPPLSEPGKARLCPECGRLLARTPVGHGVDFRVDHCTTCGGTWLDAGEWEALRSRGMHRNLHRVFSPAWAAEVSREEQRAAHEAMLIQLFGPDDLAEMRRVSAWLRHHPKSRELVAALLDEVRQAGSVDVIAAMNGA